MGSPEWRARRHRSRGCQRFAGPDTGFQEAERGAALDPIPAWADSSLANGLLKDYIRSSSNASLPTMRYSTRVKPISYLKANAAEVLANLVEVREPMIITQHGEAKAVLQDIASFEQTQETMALLKILALGNREIEEGKTKPAAEVFEQLRAKAKSA